MILLREIHEDVQVFKEEVLEEGVKKQSYFIEGPFLQTNIGNKNGRFYPMQIMRPAVDKYMREYVNQNRAWGELGHPNGPTINLERVSHRIISLTEDKNNFIGKARITANTPFGSIAKSLIDEGGKLGVSSRGLGDVKLNKEGLNEVQDNFFIATAGDIVADPSAPNAFVDAVMEGRQWMLVEGRWVEGDFERAQKAISKASSRDLEEAKLAVFAQWIKQISGA